MAAFLHSDNPVLFEVAQETAPAAFVERCDVLSDKVTHALLTFLHLADINGFITRQRIGRDATRSMDDLFNITFSFNTNQQVRLGFSTFFD